MPFDSTYGFDNHTWLFHKSAISKLNSIIPVIYLQKIHIISLKTNPLLTTHTNNQHLKTNGSLFTCS